jgi:hypothetical protein
MNPDSRDFLLREYQEVWAYSREIAGMRVKAVAFFIIVLGGVTGGAISLKMPPLELPSYFVYAAGSLLLLASVTLQVHLVRWRSQAVEYAITLNGIRAAFTDNDLTVGKYLVLPRQRIPVSGSTLDRALHDGVSLVAALVIVALVTHLLIRFTDWPERAQWIIAGFVAFAWIVGSRCYYSRMAAQADSDFASRVKFGETAR